MDYCRYSASPVGRFVLDVHGESQALWPANDALCTALQVDQPSAGLRPRTTGPSIASICRSTCSQATGRHSTRSPQRPLRPACRPPCPTWRGARQRCSSSLAPFAGQIVDRRLALEVGVIQALAENLAARLARRDPLSQRVHLNGPEAIALALRGAAGIAVGWLARPPRPHHSKLGGRQG